MTARTSASSRPRKSPGDELKDQVADGAAAGIRQGPGVGEGRGGGVGGGFFHVGGGVSAPRVIFQPDPEYSEEARKAKQQGEVLISLVVDEHGKPIKVKVIRPLGMGLDEKAMEAVSRWTFKPGMKDGKPVPVMAQVAVSFRLL